MYESALCVKAVFCSFFMAWLWLSGLQDNSLPTARMMVWRKELRRVTNAELFL
jgi:hypothetical protein